MTKFATARGCESIATWLAAAEATVAFMRSARSRSIRVIVGGGMRGSMPTTPGLLVFLAEAARTSWRVARDIKTRFPAVRMEADRIFVVDGPVWTSAGMTAGLDLALGMVHDDLDAEIARSVAQMLVLYHRRGGGQSQHSALLEMAPKSDRIQAVLTFTRANLRSGLSVEQLAEAAHLSPRQFSRAFREETSQSLAKAIERLRIEGARVMMEQTHHPVDVVAAEAGFGDRERMRRAFLRTLGQPPQTVCRNARATAAT